MSQLLRKSVDIYILVAKIEYSFLPITGSEFFFLILVLVMSFGLQIINSR